MRRKCLSTILLVCILSGRIFGQTNTGRTGEVRGRIEGSTADRNATSTLVALLREDSTLVQFTRTDKGGNWSLKGIRAGYYRLLVSHPSYMDYMMNLYIKEDSIYDLGTLVLQPKSDSLAAVIVTPRSIPMRLREDTLEYSTSNVKLKANATVEELLSWLPGVQVDENGVITVNGQKVQHLLVDGEDIFGGDPTIVTRNFNANMIAKVQVLDKKSSQADFTGVDDGQLTKTVNLVLKDDSRRGYFAKAEAGDGDQGYYNTNGILGSFKGRQQFVALAMTANNGATGFSGGSGDAGSIDVGGSSADALGASAGTGIPAVDGAGVHYSDKWNGSEDHVNGNYSYGHLSTQPYSASISQQVLPDSVYTQAQSSRSINSSQQQQFDADFDYTPDSLSAFRLTFGGLQLNGNDQYKSTASSAFNDTLVNSSASNIHGLVSNQNFNGRIMWRIGSRYKKGRKFSVTAGMSEQSNTTNGYLYSLNNFYQTNGSLLTTDTTDQRKIIGTSGLMLNGSLNYTEPLWKNVLLGLSYGVYLNRSQSLQSTFDRAGDGKYDAYVDSLSDHYQDNVLTQRATINIQGTGHPLSYTIGGDMMRYSYQEKDLLKDSAMTYQYIAFLPRVKLRYTFNQTQNIAFYYSGNSQQPGIAQLQPVQNNTNPLNIIEGNPELKPSFTHNLAVSYNSLKPIILNLGLRFSLTDNGISTKTYTDSLGRQISQPVNVSGSETGGLYFGASHRLQPIGVDLGLNTNMSLARSVNYVGNLLNDNDTYNAGEEISVAKEVPDHYGIRIRSDASYFYIRSSVNPGVITRYWTQNQRAELSYFPLPGLELNTNCNYTWQEKTSSFSQNTSTMLWNAYVSKNLLKDKLVVKWRINDILGQNAGISRSISGDSVSETTSNIIGRYWMVSLVFRWDRYGKTK